MRQQRDAASFELPLQFDIAQQAIDSKLDHARASLEGQDETLGMVEIGFLRRMLERPV